LIFLYFFLKAIKNTIFVNSFDKVMSNLDHGRFFFLVFRFQKGHLEIYIYVTHDFVALHLCFDKLFKIFFISTTL